MNTFKRKALFTAVLAGLGTVGTAEAVYLNPNGTGQVLVYPYYTVQSAGGNAWNTYLSVVNTTTRAKALKVRVLEGKTSAEVLDFNLFLSANDVWTAVIVPGATATDAARMATTDVSCTNPVGNLPLANGGEPFRNYQYATGGDALPGTGLDRTREGYIEIIEMGTLTGAWATAVTHGTTGAPANCAVVQGNTLTPSSIEAPSGGLSGTGTLINVNNGQDAGYKADALEAWRSTAFYTDAGFITPSLASASPATSVVVRAGELDATGASTFIEADRSTFVDTSGVPAGARAVASVYMHTAVINEYILDTGSASLTDWVITQPLKRVFVSSTTAAQPYTNVLTASGACETIGFTFFNREERTSTAAGADFSPLPPAGSPNSLCWESNVLSIRHPNPPADHTNAVTTSSAVLGSVNLTNVNITSTFQNGWARLTFTGAGATTLGMGSATTDRAFMDSTAATTTLAGGIPATFFGLPVTGFMVRTFRNGNLACGTATCQGNYGSLFNHSYNTRIVP
jgi:hypothetical protein